MNFRKRGFRATAVGLLIAAGLAMAPLAAWVGFAVALNAAIWQLNG